MKRAERELSFEEWKEAIDRDLKRLSGLSLKRFPEDFFPLEEWYEEGVSVAEAVITIMGFRGWARHGSRISFEEWLNEVNRIVHDRTSLILGTGYILEDFPDQPYYDWYEEGISTKEAARRVLSEYGLEEILEIDIHEYLKGSGKRSGNIKYKKGTNVIWTEKQKRELEEWAKEEERRLQKAWDRFIKAYKKWAEEDGHTLDRPILDAELDLDNVPLPPGCKIERDNVGLPFDIDFYEIDEALAGIYVVYKHRIVNEDGEIIGYIYETYDPYDEVYIEVYIS